MKDVFKNMRGAGLGGLLLMAVVFAVSVVLAGRLWQALRRAASRRKSFLRLLLFTTCPRMCAVF